MVKDIIELLEKVKDPVETSLRIKKTAEMLGIQENEIYSLVKRSRGRSKTGGTKTRPTYPSREKLLLTVLLNFPDLGAQIAKENWEDLISTAEIKSILEDIIVQGNSDPSSLLLSFDNKEAHEMISEALLSSSGITDAETASKIIQGCIGKLKLSKLDEKLKVLRIEIDEAIKEKDVQLEKKLLEEYRDLTKQKQRRKGEPYE